MIQYVFGWTLRTRLKALNITQSQFADLCEVHPNNVGNWAAGRTRMNAAADLLLELLDDRPEVRRALCMDTKPSGAPRGRPFGPGNPYRFGDRRRPVWVAGTQMARAVA
jgi:transcriptional regulator with XRE-family HTH domain